MRNLIRWFIRLFTLGVVGIVIWFFIYMFQSQQEYNATASAVQQTVYGGAQCMILIPIAIFMLLVIWFLSWISTKV